MNSKCDHKFFAEGLVQDKEAVKKKIASDFKKEVQELKDAFKQKGKKKKKELELSEEEFDWDN